MAKVIVFILKEIIFIFYNHWALTQGNGSANMATALKEPWPVNEHKSEHWATVTCQLMCCCLT